MSGFLEEHGLKLRELRAMRQHNLYAYMPVLRAVLEVGPYLEKGSDQFPGFVERLVGWLPGLREHECSIGRPGGFIERLRRGTHLPHIAEHVCIELQNMMGFDVTFGRARNAGERGVYQIIVSYEEEIPARAALTSAIKITLAAMHDEPIDVAAEI